MRTLSASVDVRVPLRTAYNQWTNFTSFPEFMAGVIEVRPLGDRYTHWVTEVAGARREFDAEIVEQLPDERIAWRSTGGDVRHKGNVSFRPLSGGRTRVTVEMSWDPDGFLEKTAGSVGIDRLQVTADVERFRRFIEERYETDRSREDRWGDTSSSGERNVLEVLTGQHNHLKDLLDQACAAEGDDKQRLFTEIAGLLRTHEKSEQRVVHPLLRSSGDDGAALADARLGEEEQADDLIAEIGKMHPGDPAFGPRLEQLRRAVVTHADHEESEEFPKLRQNLSAERLRSMADDLIAEQIAKE